MQMRNVLFLQETADVAAQPQLHSLLPLSNRVVVPGERFREIYYWDSYWVVKGLLVSQMGETATVRVPGSSPGRTFEPVVTSPSLLVIADLLFCLGWNSPLFSLRGPVSDVVFPSFLPPNQFPTGLS